MCLDILDKNIDKMETGQKCSLKRILGDELWATLTKDEKRMLGREFSRQVKAGERPNVVVHEEAGHGRTAIYKKIEKPREGFN